MRYPSDSWIPQTSWSAITGYKYAGSGTVQDPYVVEWLPAEKANPQLWPGWLKWLQVLIVSWYSFVFFFGTGVYSSALGDIALSFPGYRSEAYVMGLSSYIVGLAFGPLVWGPLSELHGRRFIFLTTACVWVAFNAGVCGAQNVWTLSILRFFAGIFGSSINNCMPVIADMFNIHDRGLGMYIYSIAPFVAPVVAPIAGGFLVSAAGWRWNCGLLAILAVTAFISFIFFAETYAPYILESRAKKLQAESKAVYVTRYQDHLGKVWKRALSRPWKILWYEPIVLLLSIYIAVVYGTFFMLLSSYPIVYQQLRGWSPGVGSLPFLGCGLGIMLAIAYLTFIESPRYHRYLREHGGAPPEQRLIQCCIGGICLASALFWFAWTAAPISVHWMISITSGGFVGFGIVLVWISIVVSFFVS